MNSSRLGFPFRRNLPTRIISCLTLIGLETTFLYLFFECRFWAGHGRTRAPSRQHMKGRLNASERIGSGQVLVSAHRLVCATPPRDPPSASTTFSRQKSAVETEGSQALPAISDKKPFREGHFSVWFVVCRCPTEIVAPYAAL
jgi:hypothetical protein